MNSEAAVAADVVVVEVEGGAKPLNPPLDGKMDRRGDDDEEGGGRVD
jgi:hypothetical protein